MNVLITQNSVRERLVKLTQDGFMSKAVAKNTAIAESSLSKFKNGKYDLPHSELIILANWLTNKGF